MFATFKRKLSRSKSISKTLSTQQDHRGVAPSLSPSEEELLAKLHMSNSNSKPTRQQFPHHNLDLAELDAKRVVCNDRSFGLLSLPTEILLALQICLRPSSEVALRHTCSRFFYLYSMPSFYLSGEEKFDFVCMTERDQDPRQLERLVCGFCREIHPKTTFPRPEIVKAPLERDCRQVWLCAHRMMGYEKTVRLIKAGVEAPFRVETIDPCSRCREVLRNRSVADRPEKGTTEVELESPKSESLLITKTVILQRPLPAYNRSVTSGSGSYKEIFGIRDVAQALQAINFRICPHIKLGDPVILSKFCRSCTATQKLPPGIKGPPCISNWNRDGDKQSTLRRCKGSCFDRQCKTRFMFQTRESLQPDASGRRQVWLFIVIYRWLGPLLKTGHDSNWRSHTTNHEDRCLMRKSWETWEKLNQGKMKPNFGISMLSPEDCNLR